MLAFVLDEALVKEQRDALKVTVPTDKLEIDNEDRFERLRDRLTRGRDGLFYRPFKGPSEIREELYHYFWQELRRSWIHQGAQGQGRA